jgi:hypothetical protein
MKGHSVFLSLSSERMKFVATWTVLISVFPLPSGGEDEGEGIDCK